MIDLPNAIAAAWVLKLVLSLYLAIMISKPDVEDLNYFADALMFGGVLCRRSRIRRLAEVTQLLMAELSGVVAATAHSLRTMLPKDRLLTRAALITWRP